MVLWLTSEAAKVFNVEIVSELGRRAKKDLQRLGVKNVQVDIGDGLNLGICYPPTSKKFG